MAISPSAKVAGACEGVADFLRVIKLAILIL
jgi:hypothetical protein